MKQGAALRVIRTETLVRGCGHEMPFKILAGEPPAFAEGRRKKWAKKQCQNCHEASIAQQKQEGKARRHEKAKARPKFRLPDGSEFALSYRAQDENYGTWSGTLSTPKGEKFSGSHSSVHVLIVDLGRQWQKEQAGEEIGC